jgi:energy-coupling factor transport system permease protein
VIVAVHERRGSPLHAARAGVAGTWCLVLGCAATLAVEHPLVLLGLLGIVAAAATGAGVGDVLARTLRWALPFALLIALVNPFVVREGLTTIWRFGEVPPLGQVDVTLEATVYGGVLGLRALVALLAGALLSAVVDPDEALRLFRRVSFRSALTAALAIRLVPVLASDARRLDEGRRCRADAGGSGRLARLAVVRAVAAGALDRAGDVAAALEVRGYGSARAPRPGSARPWSRHDLAFAASAVGLVALLVGAGWVGAAAFEAYPSLSMAAGLAELGLVAALALVALAPFADRRGIER